MIRFHTHSVIRIGAIVTILCMMLHHPLASEPPVGCSQWSLKGLSLPMSLAEVKKAHGKAKRRINPFRPDDGKRWYVWPEDRMHGLWNAVLPEGDDDDSTLISIMSVIDLSDISVDRALDAFAERWGRPAVASRAARPTGSEVERNITVWQDAECGVTVRAVHRKLYVHLLDTVNEQLIVFIDSTDSLEEDEATRREKARDATRP